MIYLDNNATTQMDPEVAAAMHPLMHNCVGNPSSTHRFGQQAKGLQLEATKVCARFFNVSPDEVIFTSGATESLNYLIHSLPTGRHIITSSLEHLAVLEPLKNSRSSITYLDPPPGKGALLTSQIEEALRPDTVCVILTGANNETGVLSPISSIAQLCHSRGIFFILDGVALLGKALCDLPQGVSAACFSAHKIHGPPGVGIAIARKSFKTRPLIMGGHQQRGLRAGTENVLGIVGLSKALELLNEKGAHWRAQMGDLRDKFEMSLISTLPDIHIHGKEEPRICNTSNIAFSGVDGEMLLMALDLAGIAASHGSACSSGTLEISRVLLNMGIAPKIARSSLRFSLSRFTTPEELDLATRVIIENVRLLRSL